MKDPLARTATYALLISIFGGGALRAAKQALLSDVVTIGGVIIAAVCALIALVRILRSDGQRTGAVASGIVLTISVGIIGLVGVPNFVRGKAKVSACQKIEAPMLSYAKRNKALIAGVNAAKDNPEGIAALLRQYSDFLGTWSGNIRNSFGLDIIIGDAAQRVSTSALGLQNAYVELAEAIEKKRPDIGQAQAVVSTAEGSLSDSIQRLGQSCITNERRK